MGILDDIRLEKRKRETAGVTSGTGIPITPPDPTPTATTNPIATRPMTVKDQIAQEKLRRIDAERSDRGLLGDVAAGIELGSYELGKRASQGLQAASVAAQDMRVSKPASVDDMLALPTEGIASKTDEVTDAIKRGIKSTYVAPIGKHILGPLGKKGEEVADIMIEQNKDLELPTRLASRPVLESLMADDLSFGDKARVFLHGTSRQLPQVGLSAGLTTLGLATGNVPLATAAGSLGLGVNFLAETGDVYDSILEANPNINKGDAASTALTHGVVATGLELLPVGNTLRIFKGAKKQIANATVGELLRRPGLARAIIGGMASQGFSEGVQETLQELSNNVAQRVYNENVDIRQNLSESAFMGMVLGVLTGGFGGGIAAVKARAKYDNLGLSELPEEVLNARAFTPQETAKAKLINEHKEILRKANLSDEDLDILAANPQAAEKYGLMPSDFHAIKVERNLDKDLAERTRQAIDNAPDEATKLGILSTLQGHVMQKFEETEMVNKEEAEAAAKAEEERKAKAAETRKRKAEGKKVEQPVEKQIRAHERTIRDYEEMMRYADRKDRARYQQKIDEAQAAIEKLKTSKEEPVTEVPKEEPTVEPAAEVKTEPRPSPISYNEYIQSKRDKDKASRTTYDEGALTYDVYGQHDDATKQALWEKLKETRAPEEMEALRKGWQEAAGEEAFSLTDRQGVEKTFYHGGPDVDITQSEAPIFVTAKSEDAQWYATERGGEKGRIHEVIPRIQNPLDTTYDGGESFIQLIKDAGIEVVDGEYGPEVPAIAEHSPYDGTNLNDAVYIPEVRKALLDAGYDSVKMWDVLENSEIPTYAILDPAKGVEIDTRRSQFEGVKGKEETAEEPYFPMSDDLTIDGINKTHKELEAMTDQDYWDLTDAVSFYDVGVGKDFKMTKQRFADVYKQGITLARNKMKRADLPLNKKEARTEIDKSYRTLYKDYVAAQGTEEAKAWRIGWIKAEALADKRTEMFVRGQVDYIKGMHVDGATQIAKEFGVASQELADYNEGMTFEFERTDGFKETGKAVIKALKERPPEEEKKPTREEEINEILKEKAAERESTIRVKKKSKKTSVTKTTRIKELEAKRDKLKQSIKRYKGAPDSELTLAKRRNRKAKMAELEQTIKELNDLTGVPVDIEEFINTANTVKSKKPAKVMKKEATELRERQQALEREIRELYANGFIEIPEFMGGLDLITNEQIEAAEALIARVKEEIDKEPNLMAAKKKSKVSADLKAIVKLLGANMYKANLVQASIKELVQNSFDAVKGANRKDGRIDIVVNPSKRLIMVRDNGIGMTKKTIEDAFLTIAGTEKPGLKAGDASGGLGMAKMLVFSQDKVWLHTIKGGKKSIIEATDEELFEGINIDPKTTKDHTGTTVVLQVPETITVDGKEYDVSFPWSTPSFLEKPLIDPTIEFRYMDESRSSRDVSDYLDNNSIFWKETFEEDAEIIKVGKHMDLSEFLPPKKVTFEWGTADVYISDKRIDWPTHTVLSAGVYQFNDSIYHAGNKKVKHNIIINLKPKVKAQHHLYPFDLKREGWKDTKTIQEDRKAVHHYLSMLALGAEADEVVETFKTIKALPKVDTGAAAGAVDIKDFILDRPKKTTESARDKISNNVFIRKDGRLYTKDSKGNYKMLWEPKKRSDDSDIGSGKTSFKAKEKMKAAKDYLIDVGIDDSKPIFHNNTTGDFERGAALFAELGSIFLEVRDKYFEHNPEQVDPDRSYFVGVSIDKKYKGVNIKIPFSASFINPLDAWNRTLQAVTLELYEAMVHELVHNNQSGHDKYYASAYHTMTSQFAADGFDIETRVKIARSLRRHQQLYNDLRAEHERSSTKNVAKSLSEGEESSSLAEMERRTGTIRERGGADKTEDSKGSLATERKSTGSRGIRRNVRSGKQSGLKHATVADEILKQLKLKRMPKNIIVWNKYDDIPYDVRIGLESGVSEPISFTPPVWHSTLINDYILKGPKKADAATWQKIIKQWTEAKVVTKKNRETGEVTVTIRDSRMPTPVVEDLEFSGLIEWLEENESITIERDHVVRFLQANSLIGAIKERTQGTVVDPMILQAIQDYTRYFKEDFKALEDKYGIAFIQANRDGIIMNLMDLNAEPEVNRLIRVIRRDTNARGSGPVDWDLLDMAGDAVPPKVIEAWEEHIKKNYPEVYTQPEGDQAKLIAEYYNHTPEIQDWFDDFIQDELFEALEDTYTEFGVEMQALGSRGITEQASGPKLVGPTKNYRNHLIDYTGRRGIFINVVDIHGNVVSANHRNLESATNTMRKLEREAPGLEGILQLETVIAPDSNELITHSHFTRSGHANLIHIRASVRTTKSGKEILFIEEIQSDWHQWAKRQGGMRTKPLNTLRENLKIARKDFSNIFKEEFGGKYDVAMTEKVWEALINTTTQYSPDGKALWLEPHEGVAINGYYAGFDKVFARQVVRAFDAEIAKLRKAQENPNLPAKGKNIQRRIDNFLKHKNNVVGNFILADKLAREVFPTVIEHEYQKNMQPMAPLKTGWESLSIKRMVQQAIAEGFDTIAWAKTPEQVADIQNWSDPSRENVQGIIHRYTTGMPQTAKKIFKEYGIKMEDFEIPTGYDSRPENVEDWETVHGFVIPESLKEAAVAGRLSLPSARERIVKGIYHIPTGEMHFAAENIKSIDEIKGLLIHEGGHYLRRHDSWFNRKYDDILEYFKSMHFDTEGNINPVIQEAFDKAYKPGISPKIWDEEALFYYLQDAANQRGTLWNRIVDLFKRWLYKYFHRTPAQLNLSGRAMADIVLTDLRKNIDAQMIADDLEVATVLASEEKTNEDAKAIEKAVKESAKKAEKLLTKHLGKAETYEDALKQLEFDQLTPSAKKVIALTDAIIKEDIKGFTRDEDTQTTNLWTRLLSSPEYYFMRDRTAAKVLSHAQDKGTERYVWENRVLGEFVPTLREIKKRNPKAYEKAARYLRKVDQTGIGFSIKWNTETREWMILNLRNKPIRAFVDEADAVKFMVFAEQQWLRQKWFNDDARKMIRAFREMTNRGFDMHIADFRRQIKNAADNEQPVPELAFVNADGTRETVTLEEAITFMGDLRGTYFPRERPSGTYLLRATKKGSPGILLTYDGYIPENTLDKKTTRVLKKIFNRTMPISWKAMMLKRQGYTVHPVEKTKTPSNVIFDVPGLLTSMQALLDSARKSAGTNKEMHEADKILLGEVDRQLALRVADVYKAKGTFSSRLKRAKDVWEGYEEDPLKAGTGYAQRVAVGKATRDTARRMLLTMTGRDVTWPEFRKANPEATYSEYRKEVKRKAINATKQDKLYEDMRLFISHVLKPDDSIDRAIGYGKAAAVFKFLGFRVASAAINQTNMALAVPATIAAHADMSLTEAWKYTTEAAHKYTLYRLEKLKAIGKLTKEMEAWINKFTTKGVLTANDRKVFDKISELGWDEAQFNHEAARVIGGKVAHGINLGMQSAMYMFGATEKANRAMTIFAGYQALKNSKKGKGKKGLQILKAAKHTSDRAHGVYGSMAKPWLIQKWRPADLLYTFMKFQHNYLLNAVELGMKYDNWKASAYMMFAPALMAGLEASAVIKLGFWLYGAAFDIEEPEEELYQAVDDEFGFGGFASRFVRHGGVGAIAHVNLRGSLQMNQPFPTRIQDVGGAPGSIIGEVMSGSKHVAQREYWKALEDFSPTAVGSASKGIREYMQGVTTSQYAPVYYGDEQLRGTPVDMAVRMFSFNPSFISAAREKQWREDQVREAFTGYRSDIKSQLIHYIQVGADDPEWWGDIEKMIYKYNEKVTQADPKFKLPIIDSDWVMNQIKVSFKPDIYERIRRN